MNQIENENIISFDKVYYGILQNIKEGHNVYFLKLKMDLETKTYDRIPFKIIGTRKNKRDKYNTFVIQPCIREYDHTEIVAIDNETKQTGRQIWTTLEPEGKKLYVDAYEFIFEMRSLVLLFKKKDILNMFFNGYEYTIEKD